MGKSIKSILCLAAFFLVWEESGNMDFDLTAFTLSPSTEQFDRCRKDDLFRIAEFFKIVVPHKASKKELKDALYKELVSQRILPDPSEAGGEEIEATTPSKADEKLSSPPLLSPPFRSPIFAPPGSLPNSDPLLVLKSKELDLRIKQEESVAKRLRLRELELELERERLRVDRGRSPPAVDSLESSPDFPSFAPLPAGPLPASSTPVSAPDVTKAPVFDVSRHINLVPPFREAKVDSYFTAFERVAATLQWPKEMWALLLQCNNGKGTRGLFCATDRTESEL